jgi:hypothetical protein
MMISNNWKIFNQIRENRVLITNMLQWRNWSDTLLHLDYMAEINILREVTTKTELLNTIRPDLF